MLRAILLLALLAAASAGCTGAGSGGCAAPLWAPRWSMMESLYTYCFGSCPLEFFGNNTAIGLFGGVVGVDHYYTNQGMPCIDGIPQEWEHQDALAVAIKAQFPRSRVLEYRITSAVPYAKAVHDLILSNPEYFIRWTHGNGSVCQMPYVEHGTENQGCAWDIVASSYNFADPNVRAWFVDNVIAPTLVVADGAWLDGDGPDNGAWMCSGQCCDIPAPYPATNSSEVDGFCEGEALVGQAVREYLIPRGGFDYNCFTFVSNSAELPNATDGGPVCAAKLQGLAALNHNATVLYTDRTGTPQYNATTVAAAAAAFLLVRGPLWWFGVTSSPSAWVNATAAALLSDFGEPLGNMTQAPGTYVFSREYQTATVSLDCSTFSASVERKMA